MKFVRMAGVVVIIISILAGLVATWQWALFGMSEDVASAWVTTLFVTTAGGAVMIAAEDLW